MLQDLFNKYIESKPIFKDRNILSISFTPGAIPHREAQIEAIGRVLAPSLKGGRPSNLFVYGKTGTGKTVVCSFVSSELEKIAEKISRKIKFIYVNCKMKKVADTEYRLIAHLSKQLGHEVPFTGLPTDKVYQEFFSAVDKEDQSIILVIDEIDALVRKTGDEILYNLTRINQELKKAKISIIGITNDLGFIDSLDPRVRSSLSEEEMVFPPYNAMQLTDILSRRASDAFYEGIVEAGVIEKCAALAAQEHGDARRALDLLRVAAETAERNSSTTVKIEHVDMAQEKIDHDRVVETIKAQPRQSQAVLMAILKLVEEGSLQENVKKERLPIVNTGDVFKVYSVICREHGMKPLTQRRISDLIAEFDLFGIIETSVVSKGRYGRTRTIELCITGDVLGKVKKLMKEAFE